MRVCIPSLNLTYTPPLKRLPHIWALRTEEDIGHSGTWSTKVSHLEMRPNSVLIKQLGNLREGKDPHDHRSLSGLHSTQTTQRWQSFQLSLATSVKAHLIFTVIQVPTALNGRRKRRFVQFIIFYSFATLGQHESTWQVLPYLTINCRQATQIQSEEEQSTHEGPSVRP